MPTRARLSLRSIARDESGLAGVEFAFVSLVLIYMLLNGFEAARWYVQRMQVANAVRMATQAAWKTCDTNHLPATVGTNCPNFTTAITRSLQSTPLGTAVALTAGYPQEGYYCVSSSGTLTLAGTLAAKPADCSVVGDKTRVPGDYVVISGTYTFTPMFPKATIGSLAPTQMTSVGYIRLQ